MAQKYSIYAVFRMQDQISPGLGRMAANMKHFGNMANSAGRSMTTKLTAPIALFGGATIKSAVDFETAMNKVEARSGATGNSLMSMSDLAKQLGSTTAFSASQAADAMSFLAMAGWDTQQILAGTPGILDLAASSETDLARAADIASNIMGQFNLQAEQSGRVADVLAAATASANVDMEMLSETFKYAGPVAKMFGMSLEDTAAAAGLLGNIGIQGTQAGTTLKNAMLQLVNPASDASEMLKKLGVETTNAQGDMVPFADIMTQFGNSLSGLGSGTQLKAINMLFGKISMAGAAELIAQAKSGRLQEYAEQLMNVEGRARSMSEIMLKGAPGAMKRFVSAFEGMMLSIAKSGLLEWFAKGMEAATRFVSSISKTSPELLKWGTIAAAAIAAAGPLLLIIGGLSSGFGMLVSGLGMAAVAGKAFFGVLATAGPMIGGLLSTLTTFVVANPIVLGIAAIAAAIAGAAYIIYDNWDNITSYFSEKWAAVTDGFKSGFIDGIVALLENFNPFSLIFDMWDGLINYITGFDLGAYLSAQVSSMANALPGWLRDMAGIGGGGEPPPPPPVSSSIRETVAGRGRGRDARARLDVNLNGVPRGTRINSEQTGDGLDYSVGVGYAWGQ